MESVKPLAGIRVLDATSGVDGQYCGKLLAAAGARVILLEPPEGTATRWRGPFLPGSPSPERSLLFRHLNEGKESAVVDFDTVSGREVLLRLLEETDVFLHNDIADGDVAIPDSVVDCRLRDFPTGGPYENWLGTEMVHQALSGSMFVTGRIDRPPLYGVGQRAYYSSGVTAYVSVVAALLERATSGLGQRVEATVFESCAAMAQNLATQYSYNGTYPIRERYPALLAVLQCRDGWIVLFALRNWAGCCKACGAEELIDDERFNTPGHRQENWTLAVELLQSAVAILSADDVMQRGQQSKVSVEKVLSLRDLVSSEQWTIRRMVREFKEDGVEQYSLGPAFKVAGISIEASSRPPSLGRDTVRLMKASECSEDDPISVRPGGSSRVPTQDAGRGPLSGLRVIDLTQAWAGPMATRSLAFLGAEVIKIESPKRIDVWRGAYRGGNQQRFPNLDPGEKPYNRNSLFNTQNHDKLALSLDLKAEGAKEILFDLCRISDVVVANFAPGVLDRLGIGYSVLRTINPGIIVAELPAFGVGGPMTSHVGMGKTMEAATGMVSLMGYGDGVPVTTGPAYLDPIGGLHGAAAIVTALYGRSQRGEGGWIDVAQTEAAALWIGEYLLEELYLHSAPIPHGNRVPDAAPHDAYPCQGEDEWLAVAVRNDTEWRCLCEAIDRTDLLDDTRFASFLERSKNQDVLYPIISAWTETKSKHQAAEMLQACGVPAAPVCNGADVASDPGLHAAHFFTTFEHPEAGRHEYPGLGYRLSRTPGLMRHPAPCFGEHNHRVLTEMLHLDQDQLERLEREGAIGSEPVEGFDIN